MQQLRSEAMAALSPLDLLVVVPLEEGLELVDDGVRSTDGAYRAAVDRTVRALADDLSINVLEVRGSRSERVRRILLEIDPHGDYTRG